MEFFVSDKQHDQEMVVIHNEELARERENTDGEEGSTNGGSNGSANGGAGNDDKSQDKRDEKLYESRGTNPPYVRRPPPVTRKAKHKTHSIPPPVPMSAQERVVLETARVSKTLGYLQIIGGGLIMLLQVALTALNSFTGQAAPGFWCGIVVSYYYRP